MDTTKQLSAVSGSNVIQGSANIALDLYVG